MSDGKRHSWISALLFTMMECVIGGFQHINYLLIQNKIDINLILNTISNTTMTNAFSKTFNVCSVDEVCRMMSDDWCMKIGSKNVRVSNKFDVSAVFNTSKAKGYENLEFLKDFMFDTFNSFSSYEPNIIFITDYNLFVHKDFYRVDRICHH